MEVAKRLAQRIGYRTIPVYDDAIRAGKVVRRLDLVKRAAETPEFMPSARAIDAGGFPGLLHKMRARERAMAPE